MTVTLADMADELDLHVLGLRDASVRAIRRSPEWLERIKDRITTAEAAAKTLRDLAEGAQNEERRTYAMVPPLAQEARP